MSRPICDILATNVAIVRKACREGKRHGQAIRHVTTTPRVGRRLLPRVLDNGQGLRASYRALAKAIREERVITPAAA